MLTTADEICAAVEERFAKIARSPKEEDVFFPGLKQRGIPKQCGPIGVMLRVVPKKMSMGSCAFRAVRRVPPTPGREGQ